MLVSQELENKNNNNTQKDDNNNIYNKVNDIDNNNPINNTQYLIPQESELDPIYKFYINNTTSNISIYNYKNNKIDTTKYTIFTFLPKDSFGYWR